MKSQGFILLMTLLTIFVLSLLGLTCLNQVLLYYRTLSSIEVQHEQFYQLEHVALELTTAPIIDKKCVVKKDMANGVISRLKKQQGCVLAVGKNTYRYWVEDLGDFPCLRVYQTGQNYSTHHQRLTLMSFVEKDAHPLLQVRFLTPILAKTCAGMVRQVRPGVSSWRYFADTG